MRCYRNCSPRGAPTKFQPAAAVVLVACLSLGLAQLQSFALLRTVRAFRVFRLFRRFKTLNLLMLSFYQSIGPVARQPALLIPRGDPPSDTTLPQPRPWTAGSQQPRRSLLHQRPCPYTSPSPSCTGSPSALSTVLFACARPPAHRPPTGCQPPP